MALPSTDMRLPHPDRLSIWPTESGYGLDITWSGPDGLRDAEVLTKQLRKLGLQARLVQELGRQWTSRVGPLGADDAKQVVALFVR